jgi:hypothetical protein
LFVYIRASSPLSMIKSFWSIDVLFIYKCRTEKIFVFNPSLSFFFYLSLNMSRIDYILTHVLLKCLYTYETWLFFIWWYIRVCAVFYYVDGCTFDRQQKVCMCDKKATIQKKRKSEQKKLAVNGLNWINFMLFSFFSFLCPRKKKSANKNKVVAYCWHSIVWVRWYFSCFLLKMSVYNRRPSSVNLNQLVTNIPVRRKAADQVERDKFEWSQVYNNYF